VRAILAERMTRGSAGVDRALAAVIVERAKLARAGLFN
jgi:hypothetical protein